MSPWSWSPPAAAKPPRDWGLRGASSRRQEKAGPKGPLGAGSSGLGPRARSPFRARPPAPHTLLCPPGPWLPHRATQSGPDLFTRAHRGRKDQPRRRAQSEGPREPRVFTAQRRPEAPGPLPCGDNAAARPSPPQSPSAAGRGSVSPATPPSPHDPGSCPTPSWPPLLRSRVGCTGLGGGAFPPVGVSLCCTQTFTSSQPGSRLNSGKAGLAKATWTRCALDPTRGGSFGRAGAAVCGLI